MSYRRQTLSIELPNPIYSTTSAIEAVKSKVVELLSVSYTNFQSNISATSTNAGGILSKFKIIRMPRFKFNNSFKFNKKNVLKFGFPIALLIIVAFVMTQLFTSTNSNPSIQGASDTVNEKPLASKTLNREFNFPLLDDKGKEAGSFKYIIESVELRKQIIVKGQRATSVDGRVFLIMNLKLVNDLNQGLNINTRDYVRVFVNGKEGELFAPDIHNDPVETQAISTKNTRLGLAINEDDRDITLRIGEIEGEKQDIKLDF